MSDSLPVICFRKGADKRARRGHPWVFSNEIDMTAQAKALPPGSPVCLAAGAEMLGTAIFNPHTLIAARLLSTDAATQIDAEFLHARIATALALRERLFDRPFYRLVHAEGDGLPGLVIDRYGDHLSVQANTAGMDRLLPDIVTVLRDMLSPRSITLRNDSPVRDLEGLERHVETVHGEIDGPVEVEENGVRFLADLEEGQKTGWFFDHRDTRAFIASLAGGAAVLDLYCHTGAFALTCAAGGAASVSGVDRSASAIALAEKSAKLNGFEMPIEFRKADVFAALEHFERTKTTFDIVVADPPAFVKSRKDLQAGMKGYRKLFRLAAKAVKPGGLLVAASCSHLVDAPSLQAQIARGLSEAGREGRILRSGGAGADHPAHVHLSETAYLKAAVLALD